MTRSQRAASFAPFDALHGLREALSLAEYEHERTARGDIAEDTAEKISKILIELQKKDIVRLVYFEEGHEKIYEGSIKLDAFNRTLRLIKTKKDISLDSLRNIDLVESGDQ